MRETLPDVLMDDRAPVIFIAGFSILLLALVALLIAAALVRERARTAGIYRKYATGNDASTRRRSVEPG